MIANSIRCLFTLLWKCRTTVDVVLIREIITSFTVNVKFQTPRALTPVSVSFDAITVLQTIAPCAVVSGRRVYALPDSVPTLKPMTPFSTVHPLPFRFHPQPMPLALRPVALVRVPAGPCVHSNYFKAVGPGTGVFPLAFGASADAVPVGFSILPAAAVCAAIVEVEPSARHSEEARMDARRRRAWMLYFPTGPNSDDQPQ